MLYRCTIWQQWASKWYQVQFRLSASQPMKMQLQTQDCFGNSINSVGLLVVVLLLLLLWHTPLGVRSTKSSHQSPEWMILSHVNCFIQGEVVGFQVLLDSLHPHSTKAVLQCGSHDKIYPCAQCQINQIKLQ